VNQLRFAPCLPADWQTFKIHYRFHETVYHITFRNLGGGRNVKQVTLDGIDQPQKILRMNDDRQEHMVQVEID
jgi:cellobiose phosphorylase